MNEIATLTAALSDRYEVTREIGAGGMATVYLARDLKHDRQVAVKVLRPELGEVLGVERFLAEIKVTANLQHPNLLPLFDSGEASGLLFYVMPYVSGESLRARLARERQLPVGEALMIAAAIAGALDHAHRQGVVHRDLKPENILLHDGQPLVADFGIALALSRAGGARMTQTGMSVGTPQYMSPEQAAADRDVDARSDIFALGCVLYEMLTGEPPHTGSTVQAVIARVLSEVPRSVRSVRPSVPEAVDEVLERALAKLPADRFATAREFGDALTHAATFATPRAGSTFGRRPATRPRLRDPLVLALAAVATLACVGASWMWLGARNIPAPVTARFVVPNLMPDGAGPPQLTPNGRSIVYVGAVGGKRFAMVRQFDQLEGHPISGTEGAIAVRVSPDGRWVLLTLPGETLVRVPMEGGVPTPVATGFRGGWPTLGAGDVLVSSGEKQGLSWQSAAGGPSHLLTVLSKEREETNHSTPLVTPDGRAVVFTVIQKRVSISSRVGELGIVPLDAKSTTTAKHSMLGIRGRFAIAIIDGWLLYAGEDMKSIMAVRLDVPERRVVGTPVAVLRETANGGIGENVAFARNGTLVYSQAGTTPTRLVLVDAQGAQQQIASVPSDGQYRNPRIAPDGSRLAVVNMSPQGVDLWIHDLATSASTRLTATGRSVGPVWIPDTRSLIYVSITGTTSTFVRQPADGSAAPEKLFTSEHFDLPGSITPDGRTLLFSSRDGKDAWGIWSAALDGDHTPKPIMQQSFDNYMPMVSPDGHWLAYVSKSSGRDEIYVTTFPAISAPVQVTHEGATEPLWSRDGARLFYRGDKKIYVASVDHRAGTFTVAPAIRLQEDDFHGGFPYSNYDVTPDGKRLLMVAPLVERKQPEVTVVMNWLPEMRARLAAAGH